MGGIMLGEKAEQSTTTRFGTADFKASNGGTEGFQL
jgi:hypothetical protein